MSGFVQFNSIPISEFIPISTIVYNVNDYSLSEVSCDNCHEYKMLDDDNAEILNGTNCANCNNGTYETIG